jgi:RNA polymerase sigma factor (sigma-70 family)
MTDVFDGLPEEKLTTAQENALSKRGTPAAHNKLVMHNMREAIKYTKRVCGGAISDDQLLSVCYGAMLNAARRFKPNWARFFAFSKAHLRGAVKEHFNSLRVMKKGFVISREELAKVFSHCDPDGPSSDNQDVEVLTGEIADPDFKTVKLREQWALVSPMLKLLSAREAMVIDLHYKSGFTLTDIGKKLGVTCEAIRHIHGSALKKIRNKLLAKHRLYSDY